jgi:hypothetical protein
MIERSGRRLRPSRSGALVVAAVSLIALAGCSGGSGGAACSAPSPAPAADLALLPAGLSLERVGTVTHVVETAGNVTVQAIATKPIDELTVLIQDAVTAAGYRPSGMDNEGDEAEVFFTSGSYAAGQATVRRANCEGRWNVELVLLDPKTLAPSSTTP